MRYPASKNQESGGQGQVDYQAVQASEPIDLSAVEAEPQMNNEVQIEKYLCPFCEIHEGRKATLKVHTSESHIQTEVAKSS